MKKTLLAVAIGSLAVASTASANFYVQGDLGYSKVKVTVDGDSDSKNVFTPSVAVGYNFGDFRLAADYKHYGNVTFSAEDDNTINNVNYVGNDTTTNKFRSVGISAIYDIHLDSDFIPYVGARIAYNSVKSSGQFSGKSTAGAVGVISHSYSDSKVGYGVLAGAAYKVSSNLFVDGGIEYNYLGSFYDNEKATQYGAKVGLRYEF